VRGEDGDRRRQIRPGGGGEGEGEGGCVRPVESVVINNVYPQTGALVGAETITCSLDFPHWP
jgi:hypothetical protein